MESYLSYETRITIDVEEHTVPFPDVSICKQQEFGIFINQTYNYREHTSKWISAYDQLSDADRELLVKHTYDQIGYYQNIAKDVLKSLKNGMSDFIIDCKWSKWTPDANIIASWRDVQQDSFDCDLQDIKYFQTPEDAECHTFRAPKLENRSSHEWWHKDGGIRGLSLILYLGSNFYTPLELFPLHFTNSNGKGYKVDIHPVKTQPKMTTALKFAPGKATSLQLYPHVRTLLGHPYVPCTTQKYSKVNEQFIQDYLYTRRLCSSHWYQSQYISKCGCLNVNIIASETMIQEYPFCGFLYDNFNKTIGRLQCLDTLNIHSEKLLAQCPEPCNAISYLTEAGSELWPHSHFLWSFYETYIQGRHFEPRFRKVKELLKVLSDNETDIFEIKDHPVEYQYIQEATDQISNNFAQLQVYFEDLQVRVYKDVKAMNASTLFSNVGGTFNLWIGVTVFTVVELLEVVVRMFENKTKVIEVSPRKEGL